MTTPLLSIIVPFYNVRPWMQDWLQSLLAQEVSDFECIVIDDASTDGSAKALADATQDDNRFQIIRQENQGPAAARNAGLKRASAPFLCFCDPDDVLPPESYLSMLERLEGDGADYATGRVLRLSSAGLKATNMHKQFHTRDRLLRPDDLSEVVLYDQISMNKVFRTDFFRRNVIGFQPLRKYEDILPMTTAALRADAISVTSTPVYYWRMREDKSSLTQTLDEAALSLRFEALRATLAAVLQWRPDLRADFTRKMFRHDLFGHLRATIRASKELRETSPDGRNAMKEMRLRVGRQFSAFFDEVDAKAYVPPDLAAVRSPLHSGNLRKATEVLSEFDAGNPVR